MRYLILGGALLVLAGCSVERSSAPVKEKAVKANTCRSGWVVRTGEDGQPDTVCAGGATLRGK